MPRQSIVWERESSFWVGCLLLCTGLLWSVVRIPRKTSSGKDDFSFAGNCQLETAFWLGMGDHAHSSLWLGPVQTLACCHNLYKFICASVLLGLEGIVSLVSPIPTGSQSFWSLVYKGLSPEGRCSKERFSMEMFHLGLGVPRSLSLHIIQCGYLHLFPSTAGINLSDDDWARQSSKG